MSVYSTRQRCRVMAKRKAADYLSALDNLKLEPSRRAALQLLQLAREMESGTFPEVRDDTTERFSTLDCVNCDNKINNAALYCGQFCQQMAQIVRYVRKAVAEGRVTKPDIQEGIGMFLLHLYAGGYATKERTLSAEQRTAIFKRDGYKCRLCGDTATEIDHVAGNSSDPSNLRALCKPCNGAAAWQNARTVTLEGNPDEWHRIHEMQNLMAQRIAAPQPLRSCDNYELWHKTQGSMRGARAKLLRELEEQADSEFEDVDSYLYNAMQKDD
jgi:5-methylcytosine-specific restriction endonuclease McrA